MKSSHRTVLAVLIALPLHAPLVLGTSAWAAGPPGKSQPERQTSANTLSDRSAFDGYQPFDANEDEPAKGWRAANDRVGKLGGHAAYVMDAETTATPPAPPPSGAAPAPSPAATPARGHAHQH